MNEVIGLLAAKTCCSVRVAPDRLVEGKSSPQSSSPVSRRLSDKRFCTKSACDLSDAFANRRRQRTLDNPLFVKPVNVSRFIDGKRRCDWIYTATDFLQCWTSNSNGAQSTVKEKNWNKHMHTQSSTHDHHDPSYTSCHCSALAASFLDPSSFATSRRCVDLLASSPPSHAFLYTRTAH